MQDNTNSKVAVEPAASTPVEVVDSILAGDLKDLIALNSDVVCNDDLKNKINSYADNDKLLQYKKELGSIKITAVDEITEEKLIAELSK